MFEELEDAELISVIRFWERVASSAAAAQLAAVAELARRRPRSYLDDGPGGHLDAGDPSAPEVSEFAVDEVAAALRLSRPAAGARLHVAVELTRLPAVSAALADGMLDVPKARAVVDAVSVLDADTAVAVAQRVLPRAAGQTVGQLRSALSRAVLTADPTAGEARHDRAVATRQVTLQPARDGMAELWALLPADAAVAVYGRIDALARRETPDSRPMDARRADALVTAVLGPCTPAASGPGTPEATGGGTSGAAGRVTPEAILGVVSSSTAVAEGAVRATASSRLDAGPVIAASSVCVTVPVGTALGLDDEPGELAGYGPVPASMARRLAGTTTWRKISTDPVTGTVVDVGRTAYTPAAALADLVRTAYTPTAALADLVRARDVTCRFPGCRRPAGRCDLDHVVPWPAGPTTADNLAALCRHHHRLKHQTPWTVRAGPAADLIWTAPTGHTYTTTPP